MMHLQTENINVENMLSLFIKGDDSAYAYFYRLYINDLYAYGVSLGGDEEMIKDVVQDVFINIFSLKVDFKSVYHLKYYLFQSVKNRLYNIYKSSSYSKTVTIDETTEFSVTVDVLGEILDKEQQLNLKRKLEKILSVLTNRQKEALFLRYSQELEYEEIANLLDMTVPASRKLVSRAIKKLREEQGVLFVWIIFLIKFNRIL